VFDTSTLLIGQERAGDSIIYISIRQVALVADFCFDGLRLY